jgi:hypothetical protein
MLLYKSPPKLNIWFKQFKQWDKDFGISGKIEKSTHICNKKHVLEN